MSLLFNGAAPEFRRAHSFISPPKPSFRTGSPPRRDPVFKRLISALKFRPFRAFRPLSLARFEARQTILRKNG
jgi:hypothetical protein